MKQHRRPLPIFVLLMVSLGIILWKGSRPQHRAAAELSPMPPVPGSIPVETATVTLPPQGSEAAPKVAPAEPGPDETDSIAGIVDGVDAMQVRTIDHAVQKLRSLPPEAVAAFFVTQLKEIGTSRPAERDRLIMVANSLQSPHALPLWLDLAQRQTPRYEDEEKLRNPPHPTLESRFIDMEQLQAIRNIGLIAREDRAARRVLMEIILTPDPTSHRTLHREQAYIALKESDLAASLRVLKQLAAEDDLLKRL